MLDWFSPGDDALQEHGHIVALVGVALEQFVQIVVGRVIEIGFNVHHVVHVIHAGLVFCARFWIAE